MEKFTLPNLNEEQSILKTIRLKQYTMNKISELSKQTNISVNRLLNECIEFALRNLSEEDLKQLKQLCDETEQLYLSGKNHIPKDIEFHTCIAKCSKNRVVETLIPLINTGVMTFANLTHRMLMEETIETHRAIVDAIWERDSVGAKCAMIMHLTYNRQVLMRMWKEHQKKKEI